MLNTRAAMIIEIVTTDPRAPSVEKQKAANRADGTTPERTFEFPEWSGEMNNIIFDRDEDLIVVTNPRVLGTLTKARPILVHMGRAGAMLKLPDSGPLPCTTDAEQEAILDLIRPWAGKTAMRGKGRPPKRSQPNDDVRRMGKRMWQRKRTQNDPDGFTLAAVVEFHEDEMGRKVAVWELKHWYGDKRAADQEE